MALAMLALQTMVILMGPLGHMRVLRDLALLLRLRLPTLLMRLRLNVLQLLHNQLKILNQRVASRAAKVLAHHHAHHLQLLTVRRHGVGRHDPAALAQLVRDGELVVFEVELGVDAEGDEGQAAAGGLGHDLEAEGFEGFGEVVRRVGQVGHDGAVAVLAETDLGECWG